MGILYDDPAADIDLIHRICQIAAEDWNSRFADEFGFLILVTPEAIGAISRTGSTVLLRAFPRDPGSPSAFKRVSTLLIMMCLHPFIVVLKKDENQTYTIPIVVGHEEWRTFAIKFIVDTIPMIFSVLLAHDGEWVPLDSWRGFQSDEFYEEFITFMKWLGNADCVTYDLGNPVYNLDRLARIILGTSLVLEASYGTIE